MARRLSRQWPASRRTQEQGLTVRKLEATRRADGLDDRALLRITVVVQFPMLDKGGVIQSMRLLGGDRAQQPPYHSRSRSAPPIR